MTMILLRRRHVCLREHICEKFLQDRRCENGKRQNNNFPVLSASVQILQIRMMWQPVLNTEWLSNIHKKCFVWASCTMHICTSDHIDVSKINDLAKSIAVRHLDDAYMIYCDNNKQAISRHDIACYKQTSRIISIVVQI